MKQTAYCILGKFQCNNYPVYFTGVINSYNKNLLNKMIIEYTVSKFKQYYISNIEFSYSVYKPNVKRYADYVNKFGIRYYRNEDYSEQIL